MTGVQTCALPISYFQVSGCSKDDVILAITSLGNTLHDSYSSADRGAFLCVYFEPAYKVRNSVDSAKNSFECLLSKIKAKTNRIV